MTTRPRLAEPGQSPFEDVSPGWLRRRGTAKWADQPVDVIAATVAEMDVPTAPEVLAAVEDAVARQEFGYTSQSALTELAEATATWQRHAHGWDVDPDRVRVLPYTLRGVELAIDYFSAPASAVVLPTPAYMPFFAIALLSNRPVIEVPLASDGGNYRLDLDAIEQAFAAGAGVFILCQPYNPIGRAFTAAELRDLAELVDRYGVRVISDEIHGALTYDRPHVPYASVSDQAAQHAVTVTSASKAWNLAGLKCAQLIISNAADVKRWGVVPERITVGASTIAIHANTAAFRYGEAWLRSVVTQLDGNRYLLRELLTDRLPAVGYQVPEATYFAWLDCRQLDLGIDPADFFLRHARVATSPGLPFGAPGAGFIRFNFATSRPILKQAITQMAAAVDSR